MEHNASDLDLSEVYILPKSLHIDFWKAPCKSESVYDLSLSGMSGLIE